MVVELVLIIMVVCVVCDVEMFVKLVNCELFVVEDDGLIVDCV